MMAAYQPQQPGAMHPGMPHGHPGMAPNPGQHMGHPLMQQGVTGPGQPHVTQAGAMMAMQPGANGMPAGGMPGGQHMGPGGGMAMHAQPGQGMAGGHAMNQITQQQMLHQMQQQQQMNPQMQSLQAHQVALMRQRQLQQAAQANGMMNMHPGMQGVTQQQMLQFQQQNPGGVHSIVLPAHLQRQQAQAQHNHAAQQNQQNQQAQMHQQMAMQQSNSQQGAQAQQGPPGPQGQPHPPQMRPQSRTANPGEQGQGQQQQPSQPQQHVQQGSVQGQAQVPQPGQAGQQQQPAQTHPNAQQGPQQTITPQQLAQLQNRQRIAIQQQMIQQKQAMQAQQQSQNLSGQQILRLALFADNLSWFNSQNGKDIAAWTEFVDKHFAPEGRLLHTFEDGASSKPKVYEVLRPTIARYFWTYFDSGAQSLRLHTENAREQHLPNGRCQVTCGAAMLTVSYPSGARLEMHGTLIALFSSLGQIDSVELQQNNTEEVVSRAEIEKILSNWSSATKSPKMTKTKIPKAQQKLQQQSEALTIDSFPKVPKGSWGVASRVQQFLEIGETMNVMSELMFFANEKKMRPEQALEALVVQYETQGGPGGPQHGNPQMGMAQNGVPMAQRTPNMQNMQMPPGQAYPSPSVSHMNLPMQNGMNGSPHLGNNVGLQPGMGMAGNTHTPSPHQTNMAAPSMMPQHSQQGTNSSAASANTSPNVNNQNKRRRSTVKAEDDGDGAQQNRVKPSPRMNKKAKPGS